MADRINSPRERSEPTTEGVARRVDALVDATLAQLRLGESVDIPGVIAAHPELAPMLGRQLRMVAQARQAARGSREATLSQPAAGPPAMHGTFADSPATNSPACPRCGGPLPIGDPTAMEVTCRTCGSTVRRPSQVTTSFNPVWTQDRIGRFELMEVVGRGGFGTVYRALDTQLTRTVAIKIPRHGYFLSQDEEQRFLREARHTARLRHPRIVPVYEVGWEGDLPYIVSEFVEGTTLSDLLERQRMDLREAATMALQLAEAVEYAHHEKVIHRDIKASNVLLDRERQPYITDFGLARAEEGESTITREGQVIGTPAYMPPEQFSSRYGRVDARSDVYSLGVLLYRMLTGEMPFRGGRRMVEYQVLHEDPRPPRLLNKSIPPDLETIVLTAMSKLPARRFASAQALADDLRRWLDGESVRARPLTALERTRRWVRRQPATTVLLTAVILSLGLLGALTVAGSLGARRPTPLTYDLPVESTAQPGRWYDLPLHRIQPREIAFTPSTTGGDWSFAPETNSVLLNSREPGIVGLGRTSATFFRIQIQISKSAWTGPAECGLVVGCKSTRLANGGEGLTMQSVGIDVTADGRAFLSRSVDSLQFGVERSPLVSSRLLRETELPLPQTAAVLLELTVAGGQITRITCQGREFPELVRLEAHERVDLPDCTGEIGIGSAWNSTRFTGCRLMLLRRQTP